jgi:hypothetical protein
MSRDTDPVKRARRLAYKRWYNMLERCRDPEHPRYHRYGGRGVKVCERWLDFDLFYADVGDPPQKGMSIDRIDNSGDYEPNNWRWATHVEQTENRIPPSQYAPYAAPEVPRYILLMDQKTRVIDVNGRIMSHREVAASLNCKIDTVAKRLARLRKSNPKVTKYLISELQELSAKYRVKTY